MVAVNLVLHVHNALELVDYRLCHIGKGLPFVDSRASIARFRERSHSLFWPMARSLAKLMKQAPKELRISFSLSADFLNMATVHDPVLLEFMQDLIAQPNCELVCEPAARGVLSLVSDSDFAASVEEHRALLRRLFGKEARVFHNADLIYSDFVGKTAADLGFDGVLLDGCEAVLPRGSSPGAVFSHPDAVDLKLIPVASSLTVDLHQAFRGGEVGRMPVSPEQMQRWIHKLAGKSDEPLTVFLSLTGDSLCGGKVVPFLTSLLERLLEDKQITLGTVSGALRQGAAKSLRVTTPMSMSPGSHDVSRWLGNSLQQDVLQKLSNLHARAVAVGDTKSRDECRRLMALENFERMQMQFFESEDDLLVRNGQKVSGPYDVYLRVRNMVEDLEMRVGKSEKTVPEVSTTTQSKPAAVQQVRPGLN